MKSSNLKIGDEIVMEQGRKKSILSLGIAAAIVLWAPATLAQPFLASTLSATNPDEPVSWSRQPALQSLSPNFLGDEALSFESMQSGAPAGTDVDHRFSVMGIRGQANSVYFPMYRQESVRAHEPYTRFEGWGVQWDHAVDADSSFSLSAHKGRNAYDTQSLLGENTDSTMASLSWTSRFGGTRRPRLTAGFFLGDEASSEEREDSLARRFYGISLGGQMTLFKQWSPFLSFKLQKSRYELQDPVTGSSMEPDLPGADYFSRLSAGWDWKLRENWSFRAEANYSLNNNELDWRYDRNKIFFGTRYDFR